MKYVKIGIVSVIFLIMITLIIYITKLSIDISILVNDNPKNVLTENELAFVSHATGARNSKEGLYDAYEKGYRLIEVDFSFTTDDVPIVMHDFDYSYMYYFDEPNIIKEISDANGNIVREKNITYDEFKKLKMKNNDTQLSLDDLINILKENKYKNLFIITDTKENNIKLLNYISSNYPKYKNKFIPQIYNRDEYDLVKELGFKNIIYTLYLSHDTEEQIVEFAKDKNIFAITMDTYWGNSTLPKKLDDINVYTYCHTINDKLEYENLLQNKIKGIYTDNIFEK